MQITIREPGSAFTHFFAMMLALISSTPLLIKTASDVSGQEFASMCVFAVSMVLLYAASATYHRVNLSDKHLKIFRKIDHMMIFALIAGTYTPVCLITLGGPLGFTLFSVVWAIAIFGMLINLFWITCPKWFSSLIYIAMGWVCVFVFGTLRNTLSTAAFLWLLAAVLSIPSVV